MRVLLLSIVLITLSGTLVGQAEPLDAEGAVRQVLTHAGQGTYTSTDEKELGWLGDASAVALTKISAGKELDAGDIGSILLIITLSYEDPRLVKADSDREPRTTLLLLRYANLATDDARLKSKIASTENYVRRQYAASIREGRNP